MIELLLKLYLTLEHRIKENQHLTLSHEKYRLRYEKSEKPILILDGCPGIVKVTGLSYGDVQLDHTITSYGHFPYHWIKSIVKDVEHDQNP